MFNENYDLAVIIPAKGPSLSLRLPNKNALPFGDKNSLLEWKISQLLQVIQPYRIYVSTEYEPFKEIARNYGVNVHDRDLILVDDNKSTVSDIVFGVVKDIKHEHIAWCHCTVPLMSPMEYLLSFNCYYSNVINGNFDSLITVNLFKEFLWNENSAINYSADKNHSVSQKLPDWYKLTQGLLMRPFTDIINEKYYVGKNPFKFELPKISGIDIDYPEDYEIAKALYPLYLEKNKQ